MTPTAAEARTRELTERTHEWRVRALLACFRQLRHDLASPLSGAALHLEMAARRIAQRPDAELAKIAENVRVSQQEVTWASGLLDLLGELARSADDALVSFSLAEAVRRGAGRQAARAEREGVRLHLPAGDADVTLFGSRDRLEQAFADVTHQAIARSSRGADVTWTLEARPGAAEGAVAAVAWPAVPEERPDRAFVLARKRPGDPPDAALFLARWAVEGFGGTLGFEGERDRSRCRATFPGEVVA